MNNLYRLSLSFIIAIAMTGCSTMHGSIDPGEAQSELRASVEAPLELSGEATQVCVVHPVAAADPIVTIHEPYNAKLYFLLDQTVFTAESETESTEIYQTLLDRNDSEIILSGHTDTSASSAYNDALAQRRAEKVRQDLIDLGIRASIINISSEGEYRPLVATPDETVEVRNRRVEINVR